MEAVSSPPRHRDFVWLALPIACCLALPGAGVILAALIVAAVTVRRRDVRAVVLRLQWRGLVSSAALGVAAGVGIVVLDSLAIDPLVEHFVHTPPDVNALGAVEGHLSAYLHLLLIALLIGGVAEELVFRGFLIGWGSHLLGKRFILPIAVASSALFGFSHLYQGLAGVIETGIVGLLLAALYVSAGCKLLPSSLAHMTIDAIGVTELYKNGAIAHFVARLV